MQSHGRAVVCAVAALIATSACAVHDPAARLSPALYQPEHVLRKAVSISRVRVVDREPRIAFGLFRLVLCGYETKVRVLEPIRGTAPSQFLSWDPLDIGSQYVVATATGPFAGRTPLNPNDRRDTECRFPEAAYRWTSAPIREIRGELHLIDPRGDMLPPAQAWDLPDRAPVPWSKAREAILDLDN